MKVIFVAETVPSQNKGEAALMHGIVRSIQNYCDDNVLFYLCSERQQLDQVEYGPGVKVLDDMGLIPLGDTASNKLKIFLKRTVKHMLFLCLYKITRRHSLKIFTGELWKAYADADVIVVGHDNAFCKFHIPLILFAKALGKKVVVYGCTIMPVVLNSKLMHKLGMYALNKVDLITTRESLTYNHLRSIGVSNAPLFCTADKAFILKPVASEEANELMHKLGLDELPKPVIGVMVVKGSTVYKAAFKNETLTADEKYQKHSREIAAALDRVHESLGGTFVSVPHCIGPGDDLDDRLCARSVRELMKHKDSLKLLEDELKVTELKGLMSAFDMVVSERTHGGINAATMYVPTLWITHPGDHRTYGIVTDTLDLPECLYNIENLTNEELSEKIISVYSEKEKVVSKLKNTVPEAERLSMSNGEYFKKYALSE